MAIVICPTLANFVEFEMLSSVAFQKGKHKLVSCWIRNHNSQTKETLKDSFIIPPEVFDDAHKNKKHSYNHRINETHEVKFKVSNFNSAGGIEVLQKHVAKQHPQFKFYVLELISETMGKTRHTCVWKRNESSETDSSIVSLRLVRIDGLKVEEHFSEGEMWEIVGNLPDDKCKLDFTSELVTKVRCHPITD